MKQVKEHRNSSSLVLFFTLIAQLSVGCKMVVVPKGPWRKKEEIIRREPLKETEVLRRTLEANFVKEEKCRNDARCVAEMEKLNRWGVITLRLAARLECSRKWREVYVIRQTRDFKVHGCHGAASFLCTILPATIITAILGVPLLAYGVKKLRRAGEHDSNAVGIIAVGGGLVGAGLAGVFSCPISKVMQRRCNRMRRKFRKSGPKRRVAKERVGDCGRELLKDTTVMIQAEASRKPKQPGSKKVKKPDGDGARADGVQPLGAEPLYEGDISPLPTTFKTNRDAEVMVDLMYLMAERGMKIPPERIIVSTNKSMDSDGGVQLSPVIIKMGEDLRRLMVSATRRETVAVKATTDRESLRSFSRPFPGNVRYRIIELTCSERLRMALRVAGDHKGNIWFESKLGRGNGQENRGSEQEQQNLENQGESTMEGEIQGLGLRGVQPGKIVSFACSPQTSTWIYLLAPPADRRQVMEFEWRAERVD